MIAELSYSIWQTWWLVFLWVLAALTIAIAGGPNARGTGVMYQPQFMPIRPRSRRPKWPIYTS